VLTGAPASPATSPKAILLDLGHAVTVNSIGLVLGAAAGADVQVRLGDAADLDSMSTAANMPTPTARCICR
jgi:hypothetical protein